jgi:hypothetical protein
VISSTSINKKVASVLAHLVHPPPLPSTPPVAVLTAKAAVASKMITVVEIAKRQIASEGGRWWAYCAVGEVREERGREGEGGKGKGKGKADKASGKGDGDGEEAEEEEMDGVFETMKTPFERSIEGKPKIRAVPVMTIYLARVKIEELGRVYGYALLGVIARCNSWRKQLTRDIGSRRMFRRGGSDPDRAEGVIRIGVGMPSGRTVNFHDTQSVVKLQDAEQLK